MLCKKEVGVESIVQGKALYQLKEHADQNGSMYGYCVDCVKGILGKQTVESTMAAIPPHYRNLKYSDIKGQDKAISRAKIYCEKDCSDWFILTGKSGNGKTMLSAVMAKHIAIKHCVSASWINIANFNVDLRDMMRTNESEKAYINKLVKPDLLVIDDIGAGFGESNYFTGTIYALLNNRGDMDKRTIITTNMTITDMADRLGTQIADRVIRSGEVVEMHGGSYSMRRPEQQAKGNSEQS